MPSSVVHTMHYDPGSRVLRITFVSGMVYDYLNVPEKVYLDMKRSASKGRFLNKFIKEKFSFRKTGH